MVESNHLLRTLAVGVAGALVLAACTPDAASPTRGSGSVAPTTAANPLTIGTVLPLTGAQAGAGPSTVAGVDLAIAEINESGGVLGHDVEVTHGDSSDLAHAQTASQTAEQWVADGVSAVIGAASSDVTLTFVDAVVDADVVQVSPAGTATALSGYHDFFFRTAPPDSVQGDALANLILSDGHTRVAILAFDESYGTGLRDVVVDSLEEGDAVVTYGHPGQEFAANADDLAGEVTAALATRPDAVVVIAFDQTAEIITQLLDAGLDASDLYLTDGNTANYGDTFETGTLAGAQGTIPGVQPTDEFKERLDLAAGGPLDSYSYGAESYDAVMLVALAAVAAGATDGVSVQSQMAAVSGASGGDRCEGFSACSEILGRGGQIAYQAVSGIGPLNENNDPSAGTVGVYTYDDDNLRQWSSQVKGEVSVP